MELRSFLVSVVASIAVALRIVSPQQRMLLSVMMMEPCFLLVWWWGSICYLLRASSSCVRGELLVRRTVLFNITLVRYGTGSIVKLSPRTRYGPLP